MVPHLLLNADSPEPQLFDCGPGQAVMFARPGPHKSINEDCLAAIEISPQCCVLAIADGVGGSPRGEEASRIAIETLTMRLGDAGPQDGLRAFILDAYEAAHEAIRQLGTGAATTLAVIEINGSSMRTYHAGDSGCLVTGRGGKQKFKTLFHSPASYAEEAGLITEAQAMDHPERHIVTSLVGVSGLSVTIGEPLQLARFDTLIAASDGLFDNLSIDEIIAAVRTGSPAQAVDRLLARTYDRMAGAHPDKPFKPDDLSLLMYRPAWRASNGAGTAITT